MGKATISGKSCHLICCSFYTVVPDAKERSQAIAALAKDTASIDKIGQYFFDRTKELLLSNSFSLVGRSTKVVDVVRDVLKVVPVMWAAELVRPIWHPSILFSTLSRQGSI
jgi:linoleate 10R-lipoxygenase